MAVVDDRVLRQRRSVKHGRLMIVYVPRASVSDTACSVSLQLRVMRTGRTKLVDSFLGVVNRVRVQMDT